MKTRVDPGCALAALKHAFPEEGFTAAPAGEGEHEIHGDNPARTEAEISAVLASDHLAYVLAAPERRRRDELLRASDWSQLPDAPLTDELRAAWRTYRLALRDVPTQPGFPASIVWPDTPAASQS